MGSCVDCPSWTGGAMGAVCPSTGDSIPARVLFEAHLVVPHGMASAMRERWPIGRGRVLMPAVGWQQR
jgi:hypothetical protein